MHNYVAKGYVAKDLISLWALLLHKLHSPRLVVSTSGINWNIPPNTSKLVQKFAYEGDM